MMIIVIIITMIIIIQMIVIIIIIVGWLVGFLMFSSTTRLYRGRAPRQSV